MFRVTLAAAAFVLALVPAQAASIYVGVCNTGVTGSCASSGTGTGLASVGSTDLNWSLDSGSARVGDQVGAPWLVDGPNSRWLTNSVAGAIANAGNFTFQTTFVIPVGFDPATAIIRGRLTSDNQTVAAYLNNFSTPVLVNLNGVTDFGIWTNFTINSNFISGLNTLRFVVNNASNSNPMGFRAEFFNTSTVSDVPEPATIFLVAAGLLSVAYARRRR
jgi:hypothetical protein